MAQTIRRFIAKMLLIPTLAVGVSGLIVVGAGAADCSLDSENPLKAGQQCSKNESQPESVTGEGGVFQTITNVLLFLIGAISVIMIIYGGIRYTISGGDSTAVQSAKNTILYAVVGLIVAILAFAVTNFVIGSFTG